MTERDPQGELDPRFSDAEATATPWSQVREQLGQAMVYWLSTVRPDGRPHVTTIAGIWLDDIVHFTTGSTERKARNLETNRNCVVTTGTDQFIGLDVVVEGDAVPITDERRLGRLAEAYIAKYDDLFVFRVRDGALRIDGGDDPVLAFEVQARKVFAFAKGEHFGQTRFRF